MSTQKRKAQKKKAREREARKKVLRRRAAKRKKAAKEKKLDKEIKENQPKLTPFMKEETQKRVEQEKKVFAKAQLAHNIEILKALEEEYDEEQTRRDELNKELEAQGLDTLQAKMDHMQAQILKDQEEVSKIENKEAGHFSYEMGQGGGIGGLTN